MKPVDSVTEQCRRMEAALRNILDISSDEFAKSQARYGLGLEVTHEPNRRG